MGLAWGRWLHRAGDALIAMEMTGSRLGLAVTGQARAFLHDPNAVRPYPESPVTA